MLHLLNSLLWIAWVYFLTLLVLALRHHHLGWKRVWQTSATTPPVKRRPSQKVPNRSGSLPTPVTARMVADFTTRHGHRSRQVMHHPPAGGDTARRHQSPRPTPRTKETRGKTYVVYVPEINRPPESHPRTQRRTTS